MNFGGVQSAERYLVMPTMCHTRRRTFRLGTLAILLLVALPLYAQAPFMVKDVATAPQSVVPSWPFYPGPMAQMNGIYFFRASDGIHGVELYRTDLTALGTWMVRDICPGACNGAPLIPGSMVVHQGLLYFAADDAIHGVELWRSDGTMGGTSLVTDLQHGMDSSYPSSFLSWNGHLLFSAITFELGRELWRTDGTSAGTELIKDFNAGWEYSYPLAQGVLGAKVVLTAFTDETGWEFWITDGTAPGTEILSDVAPGPNSGVSGQGPQYSLIHGATIFFSGSVDGTNYRLWRSDGTEAGTQPIVSGGGPPYTPTWFAELGGSVFFGAYDVGTGRELWQTDGSEAGTSLVVDAANGLAWTDPQSLLSDGTRLFYVANSDLWTSNGLAAGTVNLTQGSSQLDSIGLQKAALSGGKLFFAASDVAHGLEPWVSDGTASGTEMVADLVPGPPSALSTGPNGLFTSTTGGALFFALTSVSGWAPWTTDGSTGGTVLLRDIDDQSSSLTPYASLTAGLAPGSLYFSANDATHGLEPWFTDGTQGGTQLLADIKPNPQGFTSQIRFAAASGRAVFYIPPDAVTILEHQLWSTDGTPGGTDELSVLSNLPQLETVGQAAVVFDSGSVHRTAGTLDSTFSLADGVDSISSSTTNGFFLTKPTGVDWALWFSDTSTPGTHLVTSLPESLSAPMFLTAVQDQIFFAAEHPAAGFELWRSDGSAAGTQLVKDIRPGPDSFLASPFPDFFTNAGYGYYPYTAGALERMYFFANDSTHGRELWSSDGTEPGTLLLADLAPGPASSESRWLAAVGSHAFFTTDDGSSGRELWTTDGTVLGTHLVKDIVLGSGSSMPQNIAGVGDQAYFAAWTPENGLELWRSNGTMAGTQQVADINPGPGSSSPSALTVSPPYLYFSATDGEHGFEPWALLVPALALKPAAIGLDDSLANANGLWEPNESVKLQPVWENLATSNITAVTATGAGNKGAQDTDSSAAYGTFAPLDLRSCLSTGNCYAAMLNGPRPATHWDVALHETLSTGKVYDWPIHIAGSFDDVPDDDEAYADVEALLHAGLTAGCSGSSFCPENVVTRAQAALFLSLRLANGNANLIPFQGTVPGTGAYDCSQSGGSVFTDVDPADPFCRFIHHVAARELTSGCGGTSFCPGNALTRAQLALLIGKTLTGGSIPVTSSGAAGSYDCSPASPVIHFVDVDQNHPSCAPAHYLWANGISQGCEEARFCADGAVTRAGAAQLLVKAFNLDLP